MRLLFFVILMTAYNTIFAQDGKLQFKDYFNEFHVSVNHGIPFKEGSRQFFGGGLGMSHVFRADRIVGARTGLDLDFFHIRGNDVSPPESDKTRKNQHYYLTSLTIPLNFRISFGQKTRLFFELGARAGFVVSGYYTADVLQTGPNYETFFEPVKTRRAPVGLGTLGLNSGIGACISLNKKLDLIIHPGFGANLFFLENESMHLYGRLSVGIHLK